MSHSASPPDPGDQDRVGGRPTDRGRRAGKFIPAAIIALFVVLMAILLSVTRCASTADGVDDEGAAAVPAAVVLVAG
ncbi:hypothetical protein [Trujillonella humicola]|uniref:hypothetical protein n=1 Tax=Trujillonella humicola TaxID=3383699 RepID=UPI0039057FE3